MLNVKSFKGGFDGNLSYVIFDSAAKDAAIIDISVGPEILLGYIKKERLNLKFAVIMHSHFDHLSGYDFYRERKIKLLASENMGKGVGVKLKVDAKLKDGDELKLGNYKLKVIHTPGHIHDAICILANGKLFTSDTLFIDGCGRCDLEGADVPEMEKSLKKIKALPDETIIYPGHDYGPKKFATLGEQKKTNPCLK